jgi:hypothetical protein
VVVSEQKIEITQEAGCDAEHYNQERYSGHGLSFGGGAGLFGSPASSESSDEKWRAPSSCAQAHLVNPKTGRLSGSDDE